MPGQARTRRHGGFPFHGRRSDPWEGREQDLTFDHRGSRVYDRLVPLLLRGFYRQVAGDAAAVVPAGGSVLDAGTGPGRLLVELAGQRPDLRLTGVDLSADMVALARRNAARAGHAGRVEVHEADVAALPFGDASFDLVTSTLSMHHWRAVPPAVTELLRVLRPGGSLWIYDLRSLPEHHLVDAVSAVLGDGHLQRTIHRPRRPLGRFLARWAVTRPAAPAGSGAPGDGDGEGETSGRTAR